MKEKLQDDLELMKRGELKVVDRSQFSERENKVHREAKWDVEARGLGGPVRQI